MALLGPKQVVLSALAILGTAAGLKQIGQSFFLLPCSPSDKKFKASPLQPTTNLLLKVSERERWKLTWVNFENDTGSLQYQKLAKIFVLEIKRNENYTRPANSKANFTTCSKGSSVARVSKTRRDHMMTISIDNGSRTNENVAGRNLDVTTL